MVSSKSASLCYAYHSTQHTAVLGRQAIERATPLPVFFATVERIESIVGSADNFASARPSLAWSEMYLATAMLFRPGGPKLVLHDGDESDIRIARDYIMGFPKADAKDIRIKVE